METTNKNPVKMSLFLVLCCLTAYIIQGAMNGINPCLYAFSEAFPDQPFSKIMMLSTLVSLGQVPGNLISGPIIEKIGLKKTLISGLIIALIGGVVPYFLGSNFNLILVFRVIFAVGFGMSAPVGASLVAAYFQDPGMRSKVMGWATASSSLFGILFSTVAGVLCTISALTSFLVNLLLVISLAFAFVMPKPVAEENKETAEESTAELAQAPTVKGKIGRGWIYVVMYFMALMFFYSFYLNISTIIGTEGGSTMDASMVLNVATFAGILGGLTFGVFFQKMLGRSMGLFMLLMAISLILLAFGRNLVVYYIAAAIGGFGFTLVNTFIFMAASMVADPDRVPTATALAMAMGNLAGFVVTYFNTFMLSLFNKSGDLHFIFVIDMVFWLVGGIVYLVKPETFERSKN